MSRWPAGLFQGAAIDWPPNLTEVREFVAVHVGAPVLYAPATYRGLAGGAVPCREWQVRARRRAQNAPPARQNAPRRVRPRPPTVWIPPLPRPHQRGQLWLFGLRYPRLLEAAWTYNQNLAMPVIDLVPERLEGIISGEVEATADERKRLARFLGLTEPFLFQEQPGYRYRERG